MPKGGASAAAVGVPVPKALKFSPFAPPFTALVTAKLLNTVKLSPADDLTPELSFSYGHVLRGSHTAARALAIGTPLYPGTDTLLHGVVNQWVEVATSLTATSDAASATAQADMVNEHLKLRVYLVSYSMTLADVALWSAVHKHPQQKTLIDAAARPHLSRWFVFMSNVPAVVQTLNAVERQAATAKAAGGTAKKSHREGPADLELPQAVHGAVVTRFPPEPSGYLHIGHAKAAMTNDFFAKKYGGKMIVRFDDTNPTKEKAEFEESILQDLRLLDVSWDRITHTSDYFQELTDLCEKLIKEGKAYVDDTPVEQLREWRMIGQESPRRSLPPQDHLSLWKEMVQGTEVGQKCCVRAKIDMQEKNKCMRDPIMFRVNLTPHHITKSRFKAYPTYDFACPYVDSIEGVTHAMRTSEYKDREAQFFWFIEAMGLRKPHIYDFARLNLEYTVLSKRKLTWFVNTGRVSGWDDARFPTVRGIRRRGLTVEAMREFILLQGASKRVTNQTWEKIWALNKKHLDPIVPRYTAITAANAVRVTLVGDTVPEKLVHQSRPKHKKNPDLGTKTVSYGPAVLMEQEDIALLSVGEEITLMDWGNAIVRSVTRDDKGIVTGAEMQLHLTGDFRKTKHKMTWLAADAPLIRAKCFKFYDLITKPSLDESDVFEDFVNPHTIDEVDVLADPNLRTVSVDDLMQLERKGFYRCDAAYTGDEAKPLVLYYIPDGKKDKAPKK